MLSEAETERESRIKKAIRFIFPFSDGQLTRDNLAHIGVPFEHIDSILASLFSSGNLTFNPLQGKMTVVPERVFAIQSEKDMALTAADEEYAVIVWRLLKYIYSLP